MTFTPTPVGVFFGADGQKTPGKTVPDPFFGGVGPAPHRLHRMRRMHDRLSARGQEHPRQELPRTCGKAGAQVIPMTTVTGFSQRPDGTWEVETVRTGRWARKTGAPSPRATSSWPRALGNPETAVQDARLRHAAQAVGQARCAHPHQLGSIVGAGRMEARPDLDLTRVAITSSIHPTPDTHVEPVPLRQGLQRDGAAADADDRRPGPGGSDVPRWKQLFINAGRDRAACCGCSARGAGASAR